ncbi:MAG: sulfurtransferase [Betaproteobacteria bacterium]|nr:MAG: sulfurtransferase [Betaproteobacteria bacterium]
MKALVSTAELARHGDWRVFDCRHDLGNPALGEQQYARAHIPGALFAHLDRDLSAPKSGTNGRHPLPAPGVIAAWLGQQGLKRGDIVVAYDAGNGTMAARLWWTLRWLGHDAVAVLDGGYAKWVEEERPVTDRVPAFAPTAYPAQPQVSQAVDAPLVERHLGASDLLLVDARAAARFRGEAEPIDPVAGRIPGSKNRFCGENLTPEGCFKSAAALRREFGALLGDRAPGEVVHYCGSGVAACHNALAMEVAGFPGSRVYVGSWSEWIADARRPRAKGPE